MTEPADCLVLWYDENIVAEVARTTSDFTSLRLSYHPDWLDHAAAFPISARFPLRAGQYEGQEVYFWFLNLLPEDQSLALIGHLLHVSDLDVLGLIRHMGGDMPGALVARRPGEPFMPAAPRLHIWDEAGLAHDIRRLPRRPLLAGEEGVQMSLAGQQMKLAVVKLEDGRLSLPLDGSPSTHILKPASNQLLGSVENEAFCMRLAAACGLTVAEVETGRAEDQDYLLVRRYDRARKADRTARLHQEDLCQALGLPPYRKYEWNARVRQHGPSVAELFEAVSIGPRALPNRLALLDMLIFNILCCNVDAHAKNYALLHRGDTPILTPLYDVMCAAIYDGITSNMSQKIAGKQRGGHINGRHWVRLARDIGMTGPQVRRRVRNLSSAVLANTSNVRGRFSTEANSSMIVDAIRAKIEARCRRVLANLDDASLTDAKTDAEPPKKI